MIYAVIDTNVIVSAFLSRNPEAATVKVLKAFRDRHIKLLYNDEIFDEYQEVLSRSKFKIPQKDLSDLYKFIKKEGLLSVRVTSQEDFPDPDDAVFYEVALSKEDAFVVTGNLKHFPNTPIVVTPSEMMDILQNAKVDI